MLIQKFPNKRIQALEHQTISGYGKEELWNFMFNVCKDDHLGGHNIHMNPTVVDCTNLANDLSNKVAMAILCIYLE
jgi:hypothetical protein